MTSLFLPIFIRSYVSFHKIEASGIDTIIKTVQERENYVKLNDIDDMFIDAMIAVEDKRFFNHGGYDLLAITRSIILNAKEGEIVSGASTITQQVAKNLFLSFDQTYERKITELFLSVYLEKSYSKDDILELYVNIIYYGENQFGIYNASNHYFNKTPGDLSDHESILLACIPQWPSGYALNENYDRAARKSKRILAAMIKENYIENIDRDAIINQIEKGAKYVIITKSM